MRSPPTISVLLPVRNGGSLLREAIASLRSQSFPDFEILAVDDGSTDGSGGFLRRVAGEEPRLRVLSQEPKGIVAALEKARALARGKYLARMDADDISQPGRFEAQLEVMAADPRIVACAARVEYFPRKRVKAGARRYQRWINGLTSHEEMVRDLFVECPLPHPTLLLRADAMELVGGYRDLGWPEDYDLVLRLWEGGGRFGKVDRPLVKWRESPGRLSRTHPAYSEEAFRRCKIHFLLRSHLAERRGAVVWGAGPVGKAFARELLAQGGRLAAFVDLSPRRQGQEIHGVGVVGPGEAGRFCSELHLAAVAQPGAREEIRKALSGLGKKELEHYIAVA